MVTTTKSKSEIKSAAVYNCCNKATGEKFYLVKSDSDANTYYQVKWETAQMAWSCECPAYRNCKHRVAVMQVIELKRLARDEERSRFNNYELAIGV